MLLLRPNKDVWTQVGAQNFRRKYIVVIVEICEEFPIMCTIKHCRSLVYCCFVPNNIVTASSFHKTL